MLIILDGCPHAQYIKKLINSTCRHLYASLTLGQEALPLGMYWSPTLSILTTQIHGKIGALLYSLCSNQGQLYIVNTITYGICIRQYLCHNPPSTQVAEHQTLTLPQKQTLSHHTLTSEIKHTAINVNVKS
jgi:hypothetical protein